MRFGDRHTRNVTDWWHDGGLDRGRLGGARRVPATTTAEVERARATVLVGTEGRDVVDIAGCVRHVTVGRPVDRQLDELHHAGRDGKHEQERNPSRLHGLRNLPGTPGTVKARSCTVSEIGGSDERREADEMETCFDFSE